MEQKGVFVTFEGGEGTGKSTQCELLCSMLGNMQFDVMKTREPGGSAGAESLRKFILHHKAPLDLRSEVLLHYAARFDHLAQTILPALSKGKIVLCDRFSDSTWAYQGYGLGYGQPGILSFIQSLDAMLPVYPFRTYILESSVKVAELRRFHRGKSKDRYELMGLEFHDRVQEGFHEIARLYPERCIMVDTNFSLDVVTNIIVNDLVPLLKSVQ